MWPRGPYYWIEDRILYISIPFTWNLPDVRAKILQHDFRYDRVIVGGPAVQLMPEYLKDIAETPGQLPGVLQKVNPFATKTTIGCPNKCKFCAVGSGKIDGGVFRELDDWPNLNVICDNNPLACSRKHFDKIIDRAKLLKWVDIQNLEARLLTKYHAGRLAELKGLKTRIAWDCTSQEKYVIRALDLLKKAGINKNRVGCYVLIGYKDTPEDALYRLQTLKDLGIKPNPMRYNPLNAMTRDEYVSDKWTHKELKRFMRYWARQNWLAKIPFDEFIN